MAESMLEDFSKDTEMDDENDEIQESSGATSAEYAEEVRYFCSRKIYIVILLYGKLLLNDLVANSNAVRSGDAIAGARAHLPSFCVCGFCREMPTDKERRCCKERRGKGHRAVILSCCVWEIRKHYPSPNGQYTGIKN